MKLLLVCSLGSVLGCQVSLAALREVGSGQTHTTIQACLNVAVAGDICNVHAGTYTEQLTLQSSGTNGNVITLRNHPGDTVTVESTASPVLSIGNRSYWTITGLSLTYNGSGAAPKVINQTYSGVGVNPINGVTISNCTIMLSGGSGAGFGIYIPNSDLLIISNNTIAITSSSGGHDGMDLLYSANLSITGNTIYGNASESTGKLEDGIVVSGTNITIEENTLHDGWAYDNHPDAIVVQGDGDRDANPTADVSVSRNTIYNFTQGIYIDAIHDPIGGNNLVHSNVIYETSDYRYGGSANKMNCIVLDGERLEGAPHYAIAVQVYNNTLNCGQIHVYTLRTGTGTVIDIKNNIFLSVPFTGIYISSITGVTIDYDYYSSANATPIKWNTTNYSLAAFISATLGESGSIAGTVGLNADYTPTASSGSIGVGYDLSVYFTVDRLGAPRSVPWDVGAYEYVPLTTPRSGGNSRAGGNSRSN